LSLSSPQTPLCWIETDQVLPWLLGEERTVERQCSALLFSSFMIKTIDSLYLHQTSSNEGSESAWNHSDLCIMRFNRRKGHWWWCTIGNRLQCWIQKNSSLIYSVELHRSCLLPWVRFEGEIREFNFIFNFLVWNLYIFLCLNNLICDELHHFPCHHVSFLWRNFYNIHKLSCSLTFSFLFSKI